MKTLLVEIGAEEIPAGYIQPALQAFAQKLGDQLSHHRIDYGEITTYGTPRRLVVKASGIARALLGAAAGRGAENPHHLGRAAGGKGRHGREARAKATLVGDTLLDVLVRQEAGRAERESLGRRCTFRCAPFDRIDLGLCRAHILCLARTWRHDKR